MIKLINFEDNAILNTLNTGDFPKEILTSAARVIIILTQSWCPDWWAQKQVFNDIEDQKDLRVYCLEYDRKPFREEFTAFKESKFRNGLIPYLRFYRNGVLEKESNYCGRRELRKWLEG